MKRDAAFGVALVASGVLCVPVYEHEPYKILDSAGATTTPQYIAKLEQIKATTAVQADTISNNILTLSSNSGTSLSQKYLDILAQDSGNGTSVPVKGIQQSNVNVVHTTNLNIGGKDYTVTIDTGSADTWLVGNGFKCVNRQKREMAASRCKFGSPYVRSDSYSSIEDRHFNTSYGDGSFVSGSMATDTIIVGNITIKQQPFGLVDLAAWEGDGIASGLMGMAYPSITNAYNGKGPGPDKKGTSLPYPPIFTNMHRQKLIAPYFSLALNRPKEGLGALAFGGLPGPPIKHTGDFAHAQLQHLSISPRAPPPKGEDGLNDYMFYVVAADGFAINSQPISSSAKTELIIDSGSPLSYLPAQIAKDIHAKWSPPVTKDWLTGQYMFDCKSVKPPQIGVKLGEKFVHWAPEDLIVTASGSLCISGIQEVQTPRKGGLAPAVLGGSFLKGVVAVFDVGAGEMRFADRIR